MQASIPLIVALIISLDFWAVLLIFGIQVSRQGKGKMFQGGDRSILGLLMKNS